MEDKRTAIEIMGEALVKMMDRAMEAERKLASAEKRADEWYSSYLRIDQQLKSTAAALDDERKRMNRLRPNLVAIWTASTQSTKQRIEKATHERSENKCLTKYSF